MSVCRSVYFQLAMLRLGEHRAISPTPYQFFLHFMVQVVKLRVHLHFSWPLQISSRPFCLAEVCGGVGQEKKNSIHLLFLSRQLLTFFQSFSLMVFNLVLHMVRCLISDFLTGTQYCCFSTTLLALQRLPSQFSFFLFGLSFRLWSLLELWLCTQFE